MNLTQAIEKGEQLLAELHPEAWPETYVFICLSIEAFKSIIRDRGTLRPGLYPLLPGETEE